MDIIYRGASLGSIQFLSGPLAGSNFPINKTTIKIGRETSNDIVIPDPTVSRFHAQLLYKGTYWTIEKLSLTNSLFVNSRKVYTAIIIDHDTISMGSGTSFLFISSPAVQKPISPYPQPYQPSYQQTPPYLPYQPYPPPNPHPLQQRKTDTKTARIIFIALGVGLVIACSAANPLLISVLIGVLTILAIPILLIWALVKIVSSDNKPKPYAIPYQGISQSIIQQEQQVAYDSYNTEGSYYTSGQYIEQQNIYVYCENFNYYGQPPRSMIGGPNVVDDEDDVDEEDEEDEEEWES